MSMTVSKAEGVTVLTLTSDPQSPWPPLCQILKNLCYSPVCCSVSQHLKGLNRTSQTLLGTLQIMVGLLSIGLAIILVTSRSGSSWQMDETCFPYWCSGLFIVFGIMSILSEKFPSPCLVLINVILNFTGIGFAITTIVLYSINIGEIYVWSLCDDDYYWEHRSTTPNPSAEKKILQEKCSEGRAIVLMLLRSINAVLIVLSALELCVVISSVVLGIKTLRSREKGKNKSIDDLECYKPLLEEAATEPAV